MAFFRPPLGTFGRFEIGRVAVAAIFAVCTAVPWSAQAWTLDVMHIFLGKDGKTPIGLPAIDADGNLYGTTVESTRDQPFGTLWRISPDGKFKTLHWFKGNRKDGRAPWGSDLALGIRIP